MDDEAQGSLDDDLAGGDVDEHRLLPMGKRLCGFLNPDMGGDCRYHCSGTGDCNILHRLGFLNVQ